MLIQLIRCEKMKCKGTLIWPAFFLIPVIPVLLGCGNYLSNLGILKSQWYSLWTQISLFYSNSFFAPLIGVYCAFLWRYENFHSCRNLLFTSPVSYGSIYFSKYCLICLITLLTQLWLAVLYIAAGKIIGLEGFPPLDILTWILRGTLGGFVIATIQYILSASTPNFALPIGLGVIGGLSGLILANTRAGILWPYSLMLLGMNSNKSEDMVSGRFFLFLLICLLYLVLFNLAGIRILKHTAK